MTSNHRLGHPRLLVELAGPAGAGKSTLAHTLTERYRAGSGTIWGLPVPALLGNGAQLLPTFIPFWRHSRSLLWDEARHMVRLRTLQRALQQEDRQQARIVIFDEGPVFALAWLRGFGHGVMRSEASGEWWRTTLREWAGDVDLVVVLDASDDVLAHRIRSRPEWHEVKQASDAEISPWLARFRSALDWVLGELTHAGGPVILRIPADDPPERLAELIIGALDERTHAC